jgi:hypothetical protein
VSSPVKLLMKVLLYMFSSKTKSSPLELSTKVARKKSVSKVASVDMPILYSKLIFIKIMKATFSSQPKPKNILQMANTFRKQGLMTSNICMILRGLTMKKIIERL